MAALRTGVIGVGPKGDYQPGSGEVVLPGVRVQEDHVDSAVQLLLAGHGFAIDVLEPTQLQVIPATSRHR